MNRTILAIACSLTMSLAMATSPSPVPTNVNTQGQEQGQVQGQTQQQTAQAFGGQGGTGGSASFGAALSVNGGDQYTSTYNPITVTPINTNTNDNKLTNSNTLTSGSTSSSTNNNNSAASNANTNAGNNTGTANVVVQGDAAQERNPVSSAIAPIVYTGSDQCLVSVAGGAQGIGFGISFGMTARDEICEALKLTRQLDQMGYKAEAIKLLKAADPRVAKAFE
jgi:hypothetical protein